MVCYYYLNRSLLGRKGVTDSFLYIVCGTLLSDTWYFQFWKRREERGDSLFLLLDFFIFIYVYFKLTF